MVVCGLSVGLWSIRGGLGGTNFGEVVPNRVFRSPADISRTGPPDPAPRHPIGPDFHQQREAHLVRGAAKGLRTAVTERTLGVDADQVPSRKELDELVAILETSPRPLLIQGNRGFKRTGWPTASGETAGGSVSAASALRQFGLKYGDIGGPRHSILAAVVLDYQNDLKAARQPHTPERFRAWVQSDYLVNSWPTVPGDPRYQAPRPCESRARRVGRAVVTVGG